MNKRINELAIKAGGIWQGGYVEQANGDSVYTDRKFVHGGDMDVEQFARLLALDCMKLCTEVKEDLFTIEDNDKRDLAEMAATFCYEAIKSEFGVE